MKTVYTFVPSQSHKFPDHPERPGRLEILEPLLDSFGAERIEPVRAKEEEVARVHTTKLIQSIEQVCKQAPKIIDHAPTYVTKTSYEDALLAAGGVLTCTRAVLNGDAKNAFAIVRPPGHHAEPHQAMGFCIFNNIAIAAQDALSNGMERVMVIDYDAHHGNGTQEASKNDERFGFISTHQWGIYPGTGQVDDLPNAKKRVANVPLNAYAGDETFARICDEIFRPMVQAFRPQMLLISAGFDAHWNDPLTSLGLSTQGYYVISKKLVEMAEEFCDGKIVFVLEGGYDPHNVANGAGAVFSALTKSPLKDEADDESPYADSNHESVIAKVRKWHGL
ncbi:MAG: histone deacetylase [Anaerolineales bacterium]|nr:histone deacetylase [Anaerolineales bacterium]